MHAVAENTCVPTPDAYGPASGHIRQQQAYLTALCSELGVTPVNPDGLSCAEAGLRSHVQDQIRTLGRGVILGPS